MTLPEAFKYLIDQLSHGAAVLVVLLVAIIWGAVLVGKWSERFLQHEKKLSSFEGLHETLIELKTRVHLIYSNTLRNAPAVAQSPIALTDVGRQIVSRISAQTIFDRYKERLTVLVNEKAPKNAYDIQMVSMSAAKEEMYAMLDAGEINTIKEEAFQRGLLAEDVMTVFGVMLRDKILQDKGIPVLEVDTHAPPTPLV